MPNAPGKFRMEQKVTVIQVSYSTTQANSGEPPDHDLRPVPGFLSPRQYLLVIQVSAPPHSGLLVSPFKGWLA